MRVDERTVQQVAALARVELTPDEARRLAGDLSRVLEYVETLDELPLDEIEPSVVDARRAPAPRPDRTDDRGLSRDQALSQAPESDEEFFLVPRVVEYPE